MKRILFSLGFSCSLIANTFAADITVDQLNKQALGILAPIQNEVTEAHVVFTETEINADHVLRVALNAFHRKVGSRTTAQVKIDNLSYDYADGASPKTVVKGSLDVDFTKIFSPIEINSLLKEAIPFLEEKAKEYFLNIYGDAALFKGVVTSTNKDGKGNYIGLAGLLSLQIDFNKLPNEQREYVIIKEAFLSFHLGNKTGLKVEAFFVSNPEHQAFTKDMPGLKEFLEAVNVGDTEAVRTLTELAAEWDYLFGLYI